MLGLVRRPVDGRVEERLVLDDPVDLDAAGRGDDQPGLRVVDPDRELVRGEAAEHHAVHGAESRAGEHRDDGLGDHRHVDDDAVALGDTEAGQHAGEPGGSRRGAR